MSARSRLGRAAARAGSRSGMASNALAAMRRAVLEALDPRLLFATFNVTTTTDGGAGSLRQAILDANAAPGADTINVPAGTYTLTLAGADENLGATGDLDILDGLTIAGAGSNSTIIQAGTSSTNGIDRVFDIHNLTPVTLNDLTARHGRVFGDGGGIRNTGALTLEDTEIVMNHALADSLGGGDGGGIFTEGTTNDSISGTTTIRDSSVNDNVADEDGGGIYHVPADGDLLIDGSDVNRNEATDGDAGGIYHVSGRGDLTISASTIDENTAAGDAGGIYSVAFEGDFVMSESEVTDNESAEGGGIYHVPRTGDLTIEASAITGNTSTGDAGGIYFVPLTGDLAITGGSISDNDAAGVGGGAYLTPGTGIATIDGTTISGNTAGGEGGGINTDGTPLTIANATLDNNESNGDGGGIEAEEDLTVINSTFTNNRALQFGDGGAINVNDIGTLSITDSTIDNNTATGRGGGVRTSGDLTISGTTISNNDANDGGGLWVKQSLCVITNSTFSGNFTSENGQGGGIFFRNQDLDATLINVTVTDNTAFEGGGIFVQSGQHAPALVNTLVAENHLPDSPSGGAGPDLNGAFTSGGNNLIGIGDGSTGLTDGVNGDRVGSAAAPIDPLLGPLADNGGATFTHALLAGSPALDNADLDTAPGDDQRGVERPQGPGADIGAFERVADEPEPEPPTFSINDVSKNEGDSGLTPFTFTVTRSGSTTGTQTLDWSTEYGNSITSLADMDAQSGSVTFNPGDTTQTITVFVKGDTKVEQDNLFFVNLIKSGNAGTIVDQGRGDILNDDFDRPPPQREGSIRGHVFDDRNGNLVRDGNHEPVLKGFTVYIDDNGNGKKDSGERSTNSDSNGNYRFNDLPPDTYLVRIVPKSGWRQTKPADNDGHLVHLGQGQIATDRGFGLTRRASISGKVYRDLNRNGNPNSNEPGLGGRKVFIDKDNDGKIDPNELVATTDSSGRYRFSSVPSGFTRLRILLEGSTPTVGSDGIWHLNIKDGQVRTGKNFGLR